MAKFKIEQTEGMRWVRVSLDGDTVRTKRGALSYMHGDVKLDVPLPSIRGIWVTLLSRESFIRPRFHGTGELHLESSLGGFHILKTRADEDWILEQGAFWCGEEKIKLAVYRESMISSLWAGEGLIWYKTRVSGVGTLVVASPGPVEEVTLTNERFVVDGSFVLARTAGLQFSMRRPGRGLLGFFLAGERAARVFHGSGKLLLCVTPYWRNRMIMARDTEMATYADE